MTHYDLIILGAGSAGYPAGMYASRYKISNLILGGQPGWALATSHRVENWPGVFSAPGAEIMDNFREHAKKSGSEVLQENATKVEKKGETFYIVTTSGKEYTSDFLLVATGNSHRHLWVPGEKEMLGKWVSYCATCDGSFFRDMNVVVAGGGNTALTEALYLADICKKVYIVHRRDTFRAEDIWVEQAEKKENIEFVFNEEVAEIAGGMFVERVILKSGRELAVDGIFVAIGTIPNTQIVEHFDLEKDDEWCIVVDKRQATSVPGLYAAGDVTTNSNKFKQTIMSAAEWCLAADSIHEDILRK